MKIVKILLLLIIAVSSACANASDEKISGDNQQEDSEIKYKRYGIESAIVEYTISGSRTGTEKLIFKDWGSKEAKYENAAMTMAGFSIAENKLTIINGESTYNIDLEARTGTKIKTPFIEEMAEGAQTNDLTGIGERIMKSMGGKIIGQEEILGKECDIWEIEMAGAKSWVWNWVTLKTEVNFLGTAIIITAVSIDADVSIDNEEFEIPGDITIGEKPELNSILNKLKGGFKKGTDN